MVVVQASKFNLPTPSFSSSSKPPISLLFEPHSSSLALFNSDASISLFPSFSFPFASHQKSITIPPPSSAFTFLLLQQTPQNPNPRVLFIVGGPYRGGSKILLRFFLYRNCDSKVFEKAKVVGSKQKGIEFDDKVGVLIDISHGLKVMMVGSVNFFALYSVSSSKVLVFGVKLVGNDEGDDGLVVKLMKCAVIDCMKPVFSMSVSYKWLALGEENGVRIWNLRDLVKGKKARRVKNYGLSSGVIGDSDGFGGGGGSNSSGILNGYLDGKIENHCDSVKHRFGKCGQQSAEDGSCFVAFEQMEVKGLKSAKLPFMSLKATSIQPLSSNKFLILNSKGDLSILDVVNNAVGSNLSCHMRQLPPVLKVQKLAVLADISSRRQTVWISDGCHSVHMIDISSAINENDKRENDEKQLQISVTQAIFSSEKIQEMVPMAANSILILGQESWEMSDACQ